MGTAVVSVAVFLIFSLGISWFVGDKEKGRLDTKLDEGKKTEQRLEKDIAVLKKRTARDAERLKEIEDRLKDELSEKRRLERALAIEERQRMILEEQGAGKGGVAAADLDRERKKIREELEAKTKEEIFALTAKVKLLEEEKKRIEEDYRRKSDDVFAAVKDLELKLKESEASKLAAVKDFEVRLKETEASKTAAVKDLELKLKESEASKLAAVEAARAEVKDLEAKLKEMESSRIALEETLKAREASYSQTKTVMAEAGKENYKNQVANIETRLVSLEENKKGIDDKWSEAMVAIVKLDETAQRIEAGMLKGADGQTVGVVPLEGGQKAQADMESLKQARENVRIAMESVKAALQSSMDAETKRMKAEIAQISESLDRISVKGKAAGFDKAAVGVEGSGAMVAMGSAGLKEEAIEIKGPDSITPLKTEKLEPRTEVASLNQKLEGLNTAIDETFKSEAPLIAVIPAQTEAPAAQPVFTPVECPAVAACPEVKAVEYPAVVSCPEIKPLEVPVAAACPEVKPMEAPVAVACPEVKPMEVPVAVACPEVKPMECVAAAPCAEIKPLECPAAVACPEVKPMECPAVATVKESAPAPGVFLDTYTVAKGDSLWRIASKTEVYGNPLMWPILYKYNLSNIFNPDIIRINLLLSVPRDLSEPEKKGAVKKAKRHGSERGKKGYIKRLRQEFQNEFLQRG